MKLAVCFYGNVGGKKGSHGKGGFQNILKHLKLNKKIFESEFGKIDYFIHSWSLTEKNSIIEIIEPKDYIFEENDILKNQLKTLDDYGLKNINTYEKMFGDEFEKFFKVNFFSSQSRWYSNSKSIKLMQNYSNTKNIKYDWVLQVRLDIIFYKFFNIKDLNKSNFYVPIRDKEKDIAVNDMFFLSSQENAKNFSSIYDLRSNYSIRPPVAAKQHLDYLKINIEPVLFFQKDFNIVRLDKISMPVRLIKIMLSIMRKFISFQQWIIKKVEAIF